MKKWILWFAVACLVGGAVWAGRAAWRRHGAGTLPAGERAGGTGNLPATQEVSGGAEESAGARLESGNAELADGTARNGNPGRGSEKREGMHRGADGWDSRVETNRRDMPGNDPAYREGGSADRGGGSREASASGSTAPGVPFGAVGVVAGKAENTGEAEPGAETESQTVSPEEAERIFAGNDESAAAARELRRQAAEEEEEAEEEESGPPLWIVRSLAWDEGMQEMEVSFRFGEVAGASGGEAEAGGAVENGILVQRIPPGWEVQESSPEADAFAPGSRKLKWLLSGSAVAGREISLLATPTEGADPGDWDLAPTWFTCRWNGRACMVQPEAAAE